MIKGLSQDIAPRSFERGARPERADRGGSLSFADQLLGQGAGELEGPDRTERPAKTKSLERENKPGREPERAEKNSFARDGREGKRSAEREKDTDGDTKLRSSSEMRKKPKRPNPQDEPAADNMTAAAERMETPRQVVKKPQPTQEQAPETVEAYNSNEFFPSQMRRSALDTAQKPVMGSMQGLGSEPIMMPTKAELASETVQMIESLQAEQTGVRQAAMQEFVVRMQNELGVSPEKLLTAFAEMDQQTLMAPPEEAMGSFLAKLDLSSSKEAKAAELYQSMVQTTGDAALSEKLVGLEAGVNFEVLSPKDIAARDLDRSLNQLNNSFFMKNGSQSQALKAQLAADNMDAELARLAQQGAGPRDRNAIMAGMTMAGGAGLAKTMDAGAETASAMTLGAEAQAGPTLTGLGEGFAMPGLPGMGAETGAWSGEGGEGSFGESSNNPLMEGQPGAQNFASIQSMQREFAVRMSGAEASSATSAVKKAAVEGESTKIGSVATAASDAAPVMGMPTPNAAQPLAGAVAPSGFIIDAPKPSSQDEAENVRELIKQAQVMLKRGGGEMKLEMKPEGMGQVHLRVSVENGQVNVQMLTENDATKKLLENGLDELKAHLASHKLQVESMKVDLGREIQKQMENNQQEANREQARQFAQDFMGSFRDERQGFRQSFAEAGGFRSYGRAQNRAPLEAEPVANVQAAKAQRANDSRRLNLVA